MIDAEYLSLRLRYDSETGLFRWNDYPGINKAQRWCIDKIAGTTQRSGYICIEIDGTGYKAHRLAWVYAYGQIPKDLEVDHMDRCRDNNRLENLRLATRSENMRNLTGQTRNRSQHKNVFVHKSGRWTVMIRLHGKLHYFGIYETIEEAKLVADRERARLHGEFARAA